MTREEALSQYDEIDRRTRSIRPYWEVRDIFIKIFDDFEKQLLSNSLQLNCEGCKYYLSENGCYPLEPCGECSRWYSDQWEGKE